MPRLSKHERETRDLVAALMVQHGVTIQFLGSEHLHKIPRGQCGVDVRGSRGRMIGPVPASLKKQQCPKAAMVWIARNHPRLLAPILGESFTGQLNKAVSFRAKLGRPRI